MRNAHRNSYFAAYHNQTDKKEHFRQTINQKLPYVSFIDSIKTAILTVNSFGIDPKEFKSQLIDIFEEIDDEDTEHLIIDVRQNNGGYRANAIHLFSFIAKEEFKQRVSEHVVTSVLPESEYTQHTLSGYERFLKKYFPSSMEVNGHKTLTTDHAAPMMKPHDDVFEGNIYVITGGRTFSAGSAFALSAKNTDYITVVGEETGGGYYFHTGQFPVLYELPHSKIMLSISLVKINHYVEDTSVAKGRGVVPDVKVTLTPQHLMEGIDSALEYIVQDIQRK
jgi:C-terminal processing protease CtpA/Prc